ncbi:MAG: xylulokinase [Actinomycetota bacterium]
MSDPVFVGLDLGTSALKGVALSPGGEVLASARAGYPTDRPASGRAQQEPADWLAALRVVVAALAAEVGASTWEGIGLSGMLPTLVLADADLEAVGPAITWEDDRAQDEGADFRAESGPDELYRRTGQWVDGRYLLPMWRWIERHEPERAARATQLLGAKDFLFARLTGMPATDPSTATGFGCYGLVEGGWIQELAGDLTERLPDVRATTWTAPLSSAAADGIGLAPGLPIAVGVADSVAGALAVGVVRPGDCASLWGTSTVILGVSERPLADPDHRYLITPLALGGAWGFEMDLVSTGSALAWAASLLGLGDEGEVLDLAGRAPFGANGLRFLPFLGPGEQGTLWDPSLRGTLDGLTLGHRREDVARALVEGIALEHRRCLAVLDHAGVAPGAVVAAGAPIGSASFAAILADASGRDVIRSAVGASASAIGAALVAASVAGVDVANGAPRAERVRPDPAAASAWHEAADAHDRLLATMRGANVR